MAERTGSEAECCGDKWGTGVLFNSIHFLIFFPIVVLLYFIVPRKVRYLWLLPASYYFYMCWNVKYVVLILSSTLITWLTAGFVHSCQKKAAGRAALSVCIVFQLGLLFFFKYFDFFLDTSNRILGRIGWELLDKPFDVLLPVGISFYTFQALSYTLDVYRGEIEPEKNFFRYALFVSFFPQLVAGPIERSGNLLRQMRRIEKLELWNYENITNGLMLMVWGLFQKMVIADRVAILVNTVFDGYYMYGAVALIAAATGFALQIYCDFASYSSIAIGAARVMGFELMENFDTPYFARSISEFWHRWHISLSTWFRDYVYIPLGGSRCSKVKRYRNLLITFAVSGLWHGGGWTFLAWGILHGMYQVIGDLTKGIRQRVNDFFHTKTESFSYKMAQTVITFALVDVAWIFFRAQGLRAAMEYCLRIFTRWDPWSFFNGEIYTLGLDRAEMNILLAGLILLLLVDLIRYLKKQTFSEFLAEQCIWFRWGVLFAMMAAILVFGIYGIRFESSQFIYFQF